MTQLTRIQHELEEHQPPATRGLFVGLWFADVMFAVEYWCVRTVQAGVATLGFVRRRALPLAALGLVTGTAALGALNVRGMLGSAQLRTAELDEKALAAGLNQHRTNEGAFPARLEQLVPRYVKQLRTDPWGGAYALFKGPGGLAVVSAGPDGELGTGDDVIRIVKPQDAGWSPLADLEGWEIRESSPDHYRIRHIKQ